MIRLSKRLRCSRTYKHDYLRLFKLRCPHGPVHMWSHLPLFLSGRKRLIAQANSKVMWPKMSKSKILTAFVCARHIYLSMHFTYFQGFEYLIHTQLSQKIPFFVYMYLIPYCTLPIYFKLNISPLGQAYVLTCIQIKKSNQNIENISHFVKICNGNSPCLFTFCKMLSNLSNLPHFWQKFVKHILHILWNDFKSVKFISFLALSTTFY